MGEATEPEACEVAAIMFTALAGPASRGARQQALEAELAEEHGRLVRGLLPRQGGREVKRMEDGFLLEFSGGLPAVRFGLALQEALAERNRQVAPGRELALRIGVHLGPVVHQDGDVFGEGVNLAARLEALARPGTLFVSEAVAREVRGQLRPPAPRLWRTRLKRIRLPVAVFRIEPAGYASGPGLLSRLRALFTPLRLGS